jgi:lipoprotein-releasing system permease protein
MPFELVVALRFLREGRFQTWLIIGGTTMGVAVVVFITAIVAASQANMIRRVLGTTAHIAILPPEEIARPQRPPAEGATLPTVQSRAQRLRSIDQWQPLMETLDRNPEVIAVSPLVAGPAFAIRGDATRSVGVSGVDPARFNRIFAMNEKIVAGEFRVHPGEAVIGVVLASDLGIGLGDRFNLVTERLGTGAPEPFTVVGLVDLGAREANRRAVYVGLRTAQALFDLPGGVSELDLKIADLFDADRVAAGIRAQTGLDVQAWMSTFEQLMTAINAQTVTNRAIRAFVVIVVVLGIASVLVVWVVQKRREIGILRAMGASRGAIQRVFLLQGAIVALTGSMIGCLLAGSWVWLFVTLVRNPDGTPIFPVEVTPAIYITTAVAAIVFGLLAAAAPARRAAKLDPAQAIRM